MLSYGAYDQCHICAVHSCSMLQSLLSCATGSLSFQCSKQMYTRIIYRSTSSSAYTITVRLLMSPVIHPHVLLSICCTVEY